MTGAELLADKLKQRSVEFISTLCGQGQDPFYAACLVTGIRLIDTRDDQAAAYIADACGRLSRQGLECDRPTVVCVPLVRSSPAD